MCGAIPHIWKCLFSLKQIAKNRRFRYSSLRIPMFPHYVLHSRYTKATHTWWSFSNRDIRHLLSSRRDTDKLFVRSSENREYKSC
jgi:hypothetical protein